jgi:hypothetical protein
LSDDGVRFDGGWGHGGGLGGGAGDGAETAGTPATAASHGLIIFFA